MTLTKQRGGGRPGPPGTGPAGLCDSDFKVGGSLTSESAAACRAYRDLGARNLRSPKS